jgi:hypothetical protein
VARASAPARVVDVDPQALLVRADRGSLTRGALCLAGGALVLARPAQMGDGQKSGHAPEHDEEHEHRVEAGHRATFWLRGRTVGGPVTSRR